MLVLTLALVAAAVAAAGPHAAAPVLGQVISLDSQDAWSVAHDPSDVGKRDGWFLAARPGAKPIRVPGTMQEALGDVHGVAWYWRTVSLPRPRHPNERTILRFWSIDYQGEVWVNGAYVGKRECADTLVELDVTSAVRRGRPNLIAVRVVNPTDVPIDGLVIGQTPGRNRGPAWSIGSTYNAGGIQDSVELLTTSAVRITDLYLKPNPATGAIDVDVAVRNALDRSAESSVTLTVAGASGGGTLSMATVRRTLKPGPALVRVRVKVDNVRLWQLHDPALYRVTARIGYAGSPSLDETSSTCGFRDFRFSDGYYRLNGRRVFLKSAHFGGDSPLTGIVPFDPDLVRKDFLHLKAMGFNMARCIAGMGRRAVMDLADELGLMVYDESYASWCLQPSPHLGSRFRRSVAGMVRRDRNHPSVVIWGLLNETPDGPVFQEAVNALPFVKALDDTRIVMLASGRWDVYLAPQPEPADRPALPQSWGAGATFAVPFVACNKTGADLTHDGSVFPANMVTMHVGSGGEPAALRFTAPTGGVYRVTARFRGVAGPPANGPVTTSSVIVYAAGRQVFADTINCGGRGNEAAFDASIDLKRGQTIDVACGSGNDTFNSDTTGIEVVVTGPDGLAHDAASEWSIARNPNGVWTYGHLKSPAASATAFVKAPGAFDGIRRRVGGLSNPGSTVWEDVLDDQHPYQACPHTAAIIGKLRTLHDGKRPLFVSEYGFGSANNLFHLRGHYNQVDVGYAFDRAALDRVFAEQFVPDWNRWGLVDTFGNMESYFRQCVAMEAAGRLQGTSAIRANPHVVGHSLTACHDTVMAAEGLITSFREPKPGVHDAMFDAWSPLRFSVFAEPVHVTRNGTGHVEAVLINEDVLRPGVYPVRVQVLGPNGHRALDTTVDVSIPDHTTRPEPPFASLVFSADVPMSGPPGAYKLWAFIEDGAAAEGGQATFWAHDPADFPQVPAVVTLWGDDAGLAAALAARGIATRPFAPNQPERETILVGTGAGDFAELARHVARGSSAVFLCPSVFARAGDETAMLPLARKGNLATSNDWLYQNNDWAKDHAVFRGLPGGLLDYQYYREILGNRFFAGQEAPETVVSGMINTSFGYASGLTICAYRVGAGRVWLNSLLIRENLSAETCHPVAERLLRNLLIEAARGASGPTAALPDDFDRQLETMGYTP